MKKNILVVDDSESIRELVGGALSEAGFEVHKKVDGQDAMGYVENIKNKLELIVTDLNMPNMNGIDLVRKVRSIQAYQYLPILILTTESQKEKRMEAKEAGATGWIVKPFEKERLLKIINKVIR